MFNIGDYVYIKSKSKGRKLEDVEYPIDVPYPIIEKYHSGNDIVYVIQSDYYLEKDFEHEKAFYHTNLEDDLFQI